MKSAFTLLELLVVIAIIGILSSMVLSSLNSSRISAQEKSIQQGVNELAKSLEMHRLETGDYSGYVEPGGYFWKDPSECKDGLPPSYSNKEFISDEGATICENMLQYLSMPNTGVDTDMSLWVASNGSDYVIKVKATDAAFYTGRWICADSRGGRRSDTTYSGTISNFCADQPTAS